MEESQLITSNKSQHSEKAEKELKGDRKQAKQMS